MSVLPGVRRSSSACVTTTKRSAGNIGMERPMIEEQWFFSDVTNETELACAAPCHFKAVCRQGVSCSKHLKGTICMQCCTMT